MINDRHGSGENEPEGRGPAHSPRDVPFAPPSQPVPVFCIKCKRAYLSSEMRYLKRPSPLGPYNEDQPGDWLCAHEDCNAAGFCFDIWPINHPSPAFPIDAHDIDPEAFIDFDDDAFDHQAFAFDDDDDDDDDEPSISESAEDQPQGADLHDPLDDALDVETEIDSEEDDDADDDSDSIDPARLLADFLTLLQAHTDAHTPDAASTEDDTLNSSSKHIWLDINTDIASANDAGPKGNTEQPDLRHPKHDGDIPF